MSISPHLTVPSNNFLTPPETSFRLVFIQR
jgi:hypothetical protein